MQQQIDVEDELAIARDREERIREIEVSVYIEKKSIIRNWLDFYRVW